MRNPLFALLLLFAAGASHATELEVVKVVKADLIEARVDGAPRTLHLGGVWVPSPPGVDKVPHYLGEAARELVARLLEESPASFVPYGRAQAGQPLAVRITLDDGEDLAAMLASLGMALCDRPSAASPDHGDAVCNAERDARRGYRGIHDGGFQAFAQQQGHVVDLGLLFHWVGNTLARPGSSGGGNTVVVVSDGRGSDWGTTHSLPPMRTVVQSIRDYGASMGLPPDNSSAGR